MKKIVAILLLGCLGLNLTGYHVVFHFRKAGLRMAMKRMMRRQVRSRDEVVFSFSLTEQNRHNKPEWEDENEFRLHGKMYDVIGKKVENGKLVVRCISDDKETELINKYEDVLDKQLGKSSKHRTAALIKLFTSPYTIPSTFLQTAFVNPAKKLFPRHQPGIVAVYRDVITPPPRFC